MAAEEPSDLVRQLRNANAARLHELLAGRVDEFSLLHVRRLLLNPFCTTEHIEVIARQRRLRSIYAVQAALSRHRKTPEAVVLGLIPRLFWRDLLAIHLDVSLRATVRKVAEGYLVKRLPRLAVGEKIAIARRAGSGVLDHLHQDPDLRVIQAMLENPRLTEPMVLLMITGRHARPRTLDLIAANGRWGRRYEIRLALCRHPMTPFRAVFEILPALKRGDLESLIEIEDLSSVVHRRAAELLEQKTPRTR